MTANTDMSMVMCQWLFDPVRSRVVPDTCCSQLKLKHQPLRGDCGVLRCFSFFKSRLRCSRLSATLARRQATVAHRHSAGGGRPHEDRKRREEKMAGHANRSVAPKAHCHLRYNSPLLLLVLLAIATTTVRLRGTEAGGIQSVRGFPAPEGGFRPVGGRASNDDPAGWKSSNGFMVVTRFKPARLAIAQQLNQGKWLVVRIEPTRRAKRWKWVRLKLGRRATKPQRDNRLRTEFLEVFRMTCYALDSRKVGKSRREEGSNLEGKARSSTHRDVPVDAHMDQCHEEIEGYKRGKFRFTRYTYEIAEEHKTWILEYLHRRRENQQLDAFAALTVYFNCQIPSELHRDENASECRGNTISEFHPALLPHYNYNTLAVEYVREGIEPEDLADEKVALPAPQKEAFGSVTVWWVQELKATGNDAEHKGEIHGIRASGLTQPVIRIDHGGSSQAATERVLLQEVQLKLKDDEGEPFIGFYVRDKWNVTHIFNINRKYPVKFAPLSVPEIYSYTPKGVRQQFDEENLHRGPIIVVRLQKTRFFFFFLRRDSVKQEGGENVFTASCGNSFLSVAECLRQWKGKKVFKVFIAADNLAYLQSFVHGIKLLPVNPLFDTPLIPAVEEWHYVLEGRLTGAIKVQQGSQQIQMLGVMESPSVKTKFYVPLWQSYIQVAAAIPKIHLGTRNGWSPAYYCPGGLQLAFDTPSRSVEYMQLIDSSERWSRVGYWGSSATVQVTISLTERYFTDGSEVPQKLFPPDWLALLIRQSTTSARPEEALFTDVICKGQIHEIFWSEVRQATALKVDLLDTITLLSPPVIDDVSGRRYKLSEEGR